MKIAKLFRARIHSYIFQRLCTWHPLRWRIASLLAKRRPQHNQISLPEVDKRIIDLKRDGITFLNQFIDKEAIVRIKKHLNGAVLNERFAGRRRNFSINNVPANVHVAEYETDHILKCPDIVAIANHPLLVDIAARYLECKPTISNISVWWSFPADGSAQEAENYHRDVDEWRFIKFFLYLTDVDLETGPHCYVKGSHRSSQFLRIRRIQDHEVVAAFPESEMLTINGLAGDAFLEDTFGLHKGTPPICKRRLLLQVQYSISPIVLYDYNEKLKRCDDLGFDPYINRLFWTEKGV